MIHTDTAFRTKRDEYHERGQAVYRVIAAQKGKEWRIGVTAPSVSVVIAGLTGPQEKVEAFGLDLVNLIEDNRG